ncbi:MAG: iron-containing alcohol dehydrogenase, partial [Alphaproteobacteria bacterium]|nr:iron-containing alcohol dehydrogenase [Alphaproteobacteria bacterium]
MASSSVFTYFDIDRVVSGEPFDTAAATEAERQGAERIYLIVGGTLSRDTDTVARLEQALGSRLIGICNRMASHTPLDDVVAAANEARAGKADLILTVGGGSVTDGGKLVVACLANDASDMETLRSYRATSEREMQTPTVRQVAVPTTLSGGEFNVTAGGTDPVRHVKQMYRHPLMVPRAVILDPALTVHTPEWLWLSTGVRAVDHAVEGLCSIHAHPFADGAAAHALRLLGRGLPRTRAAPDDLDARLDAMAATWLSMVGPMAGVSRGASHGIGHVLGGTADVPHGYTSCIMLPHVLRYNEPVNAAQQAMVSALLDRPDDAAAEVVGDL